MRYIPTTRILKKYIYKVQIYKERFLYDIDVWRLHQYKLIFLIYNGEVDVYKIHKMYEMFMQSIGPEW